ncbi:MAG: TIGR01777 family oxidoreductase [Halioglobus sp.]|nr:TIGR01777 family oxidoreductase [Halioglobus sp.]
MQILLTGGTGFIGTSLAQSLLEDGNELIVLSRRGHTDRPRCRYVQSLDKISGRVKLDAVINLAGASLAARRWSAAYKREIVTSRLDVTRELLALFSRMERRPPVLLSASAVGYYGHHGDGVLIESSPPAPGFAQALCRDWEGLALQVESLGVRVCLLRLGVVLDSGGGALAQMAKSFRFGVASWLGSGHQWLSWVHRRDVVRALIFLLKRGDMQGPFNITSPGPVTSRGFAAALQAHHSTFVRAGVPAPVMRALVGEMADELLLNGQRVVPQRLQAAGFEFTYPDIESALAACYADHTRLRTRNSSG